MSRGIRACNLGGLNKRRGLKVCVGYQVRQETPEQGRRTRQPKRCEYNNKDKDNIPKTLNDKYTTNHIASAKILLICWTANAAENNTSEREF